MKHIFFLLFSAAHILIEASQVSVSRGRRGGVAVDDGSTAPFSDASHNTEELVYLTSTLNSSPFHEIKREEEVRRVCNSDLNAILRSQMHESSRERGERDGFVMRLSVPQSC